MATEQQIRDAAKKTPASRTPQEQQLVDRAMRVGNQAARNLNHEAERTQRTFGR